MNTGTTIVTRRDIGDLADRAVVLEPRELRLDDAYFDQDVRITCGGDVG